MPAPGLTALPSPYRLPLPAALSIAIVQAAVATLALAPPRGHPSGPPPIPWPPAELPLAFWLLLATGTLAAVIGVVVWHGRRDAPAAGLALLGFAQWLAGDAAALHALGAAALPAGLFPLLAPIHDLGLLLATAALAAVAWHTPAPPRRLRGAWLVLALLLSLPRLFAPAAAPALGLPLLLGLAVLVAIVLLQWHRTRHDAVGRAAILAVAHALGFGLALAVVLALLPMIADSPAPLLDRYGVGLLLPVTVGLALVVVRYRPYALGQGWARVWRVFGGGLLVIALDVALLELFPLDRTAAFALALALGGWCYVPARKLAARWMRASGRTRAPALPEVLRRALGHAHDSRRTLWENALGQLLSPASVEVLPQPVARARIVADGARLDVPGAGGSPALALRGAERGRRLFRGQDVRDIDTLRAVVDHIATFQGALAEGQREERQRIAHDLHDDIGARLLTLTHRSDAGTATALRAVFDDFRLIVHSLGHGEHDLADAAGLWREDAAQRCDAAGAELAWQDALDDARAALSGLAYLNTTRILREAIARALADGDGRAIGISLSLTTGDGNCRLHLRVRYPCVNALGGPVHLPSLMRRRAEEIGGRLSIDLRDGLHVLTLMLPVQRAC